MADVAKLVILPDGAALLALTAMDEHLRSRRWQRAQNAAASVLVGVRKRLTVGVRAVLLDGDRVLLVRHTYLPGWQFPGGGVEPVETAETAAAREALEETGYRGRRPAALHGLFLNRIAGGGRDHVAVYVWREFRSAARVRAEPRDRRVRVVRDRRAAGRIEPGTARAGFAEIARRRRRPPRSAKWSTAQRSPLRMVRFIQR